MVLTRAQRAQTSVPDSPLKSSISKAPIRRGRAKKEADAEPEFKPTRTARVAQTAKTTKAAPEAKPIELESSTSARTTSARTATTKASAARAASAKPRAAKSTTEPAKSTTRKAPAATTAVATQAKLWRASSVRATGSKKAATTTRNAKSTKSAKEIENEELPQMEAEDHVTDEVLDSSGNTQGDKENHREALAESLVPQNHKQVLSMGPPPLPPVSPFKLSLLSSSQGLGSVRKPPVVGALLASPVKSFALAHPPAKPSLNIGSPVKPNTQVKDAVGVVASPRRPASSGSDRAVNDSEIDSPKRPHEDLITSTSPKRLKTAVSMPCLTSPQRSQASSLDSPPSPTKSSFRSPEKRPGFSPKKVSWHQTPDRFKVILATTPPPTAPGILDGCIFYLDINNLSGSNQNSLFAGLITDLGGQCVEEWTHNNMGVTHVLFMNGETRTLEKVVASNGEVHCVSLGWLLDCERENLRIPEQQPRYMVDLAHVPGHTPKPNRVIPSTPVTSRTPGPVSHTPAIAPPKWALPATPAVPREPFSTLSGSLLIKTPAYLATMAPPPSVGMGVVHEEDKENRSPVSEATPLIQKTCPPKQLGKSILAMSTGISATPLRNRFLAGKRRRSFDGTAGVSKIGGGLGSPSRKGLGSSLAMPARRELGSPTRRGL